MTFHVKENVLNDDECERVLEIASGKWKEGRTITAGNKRKSDIVFSEKPWLYELARRNLALVNYPFKLTNVEPMQITRYRDNGFYDFHYDGDGITPIHAPKTIYDGLTRKLSITVALNDDFDGGEFEIWGADPIRLKKGSMIVFPSYFLHRVLPVTAGTRYSLVTWFLGEPLK